MYVSEKKLPSKIRKSRSITKQMFHCFLYILLKTYEANALNI